MHQINQLSSFDAAFSNLYSSSLGLADQERQFDTSEQQPTYRGMPVQVVESFPIHNSRSDIYQNEVAHSNSLNEYIIEPLTNFDSENASGTDLPEIPQSILDEYVPFQSDNETVNYAQSSITPFIQLTNPTAGIHSSQDLWPVAVVNPLLHQATSDNQAPQVEFNVDGSSSLVERQRERKRNRQRERYKTDPVYAERKRERQRERQRERYKTDPAYAERKRERKRERYKTDPAYAERQRELQRERQREQRRERYKTDPAYAERQRERYKTDPPYAERQREQQRERQRERYKTDPAYAERQRERQRERYKTDPAYAERQRIYLNTYNRIKRQTSNKEEAKKQAAIARDQYLQSVNLAKNSGDLPLTSNLAETTQSSSKNLDGTAPLLFSRQTERISTVQIEPISP